MSAEQVDLQQRPVQGGPLIQEKGVIEQWVSQGRIPRLVEMFQDGKRLIVCFLPPKGIQPGDIEGWVGGYGPGYRSPTGKFRGLAEDVGTLTPSQARRAEERIKAIKASLGL